MITHTNAIVKIGKNRFQQGAIFDNAKFVAGYYDDWKQKFEPAISKFECEVANIEITENPMGDKVAIVTPK